MAKTEEAIEKREINRGIYPCVRVKTERPAVTIVGFGDLHAGADTFNEKKAIEVRDFIKNRNALWIGMGDFAENANRASVGSGVYDQLMNPKEQIEYLREFLKPIAPQCMGFLRGNHEERTYKLAGVDICDILCYELKMPYCGWEFFGVITGDKRAYTIYAVHSYQTNKTGGLALNMVERDIEKMMGNIDIVMRGHTHKSAYQYSEYFDIDSHNNAVSIRKRACVITGHFLNRANSYAAAKVLRGDPPGTIALELEMKRGTERKITPIYLLD